MKRSNTSTKISKLKCPICFAVHNLTRIKRDRLALVSPWYFRNLPSFCSTEYRDNRKNISIPIHCSNWFSLDTFPIFFSASVVEPLRKFNAKSLHSCVVRFTRETNASTERIGNLKALRLYTMAVSCVSYILLLFNSYTDTHWVLVAGIGDQEGRLLIQMDQSLVRVAECSFWTERVEPFVKLGRGCSPKQLFCRRQRWGNHGQVCKPNLGIFDKYASIQRPFAFRGWSKIARFEFFEKENSVLNFYLPT